MTATANFFHSLGIVLASSRRRAVWLSILMAASAFDIWWLDTVAHSFEASGYPYSAGVATGVAFSIVFLAILAFARFAVHVIRQTVSR